MSICCCLNDIFWEFTDNYLFIPLVKILWGFLFFYGRYWFWFEVFLIDFFILSMMHLIYGNLLLRLIVMKNNHGVLKLSQYFQIIIHTKQLSRNWWFWGRTNWSCKSKSLFWKSCNFICLWETKEMRVYS